MGESQSRWQKHPLNQRIKPKRRGNDFRSTLVVGHFSSAFAVDITHPAWLDFSL